MRRKASCWLLGGEGWGVSVLFFLFLSFDFLGEDRWEMGGGGFTYAFTCTAVRRVVRINGLTCMFARIWLER